MNSSEELARVIDELEERIQYVGELAAEAVNNARSTDHIDKPERVAGQYERGLALAEANGGMLPILERLRMLRDQPQVEYAVQAAEPVRLTAETVEDFYSETTARRVKVAVAPGRVINIDVAVQHSGSVVAVDAEVVDDDHAKAVRSAFEDARAMEMSPARADVLTGAVSGIGAQLAQQLNRINTPAPRPPLTPEQRAQIEATTAYAMPLPEAAPVPNLDVDHGPMPFEPVEDQYVSGVQVVGGERVFGLYQERSGNDGARLELMSGQPGKSTLVWADTLEAYRPNPGDNPEVIGSYYDSGDPLFQRTVIGRLTHYERQREPDHELANIRNDQGDQLVPLHTLRPAVTAEPGPA